ncbi:Tat pathway signal sequence domain protein [Actinacidiphila alni]|uniref:Tat pathway signal sequence domain protein n=1 Tax=Actinacidiphila alni TaxID=380248 RepID=UPI0033FD80AD
MTRRSSTPSRRTLLTAASGSAAALLTGALATPAVASTQPDRSGRPGRPDRPGCPDALAASVSRAFAFLDAKFDEYGTGDALRVPRSYTGGFFETPTWTFVSSFAYDDALMIIAWLGRGRPGDIHRATVLGDTLLYAQDHDPIGDGRTRASYQPDSFTTPTGSLDIGSPAAYTGNQAWVGMAFAHLYARTRHHRFLDGALRAADWIQRHTFDGTRAPYGYTGGRTADDQPNTYKATEHNIDTGAFFTMLARLTGKQVWRDRAAVAFSFVDAMRDRAGGHLWTGTDPDGVTTNRTPIPEDVQTWAYLATLDHRYSSSVDWVLRKLTAHDAGVSGVSFSDTDVSKVWLEGTAHTALAVRTRAARGDDRRAADLLRNIERAQATTPVGDGRGIPAASSDGLDTGFGDTYYASLHTGATAWYLLAALGHNPFRLPR